MQSRPTRIAVIGAGLSIVAAGAVLMTQRANAPPTVRVTTSHRSAGHKQGERVHIVAEAPLVDGATFAQWLGNAKVDDPTRADTTATVTADGDLELHAPYWLPSNPPRAPILPLSSTPARGP